MQIRPLVWTPACYRISPTVLRRYHSPFGSFLFPFVSILLSSFRLHFPPSLVSFFSQSPRLAPFQQCAHRCAVQNFFVAIFQFSSPSTSPCSSCGSVARDIVFAFVFFPHFSLRPSPRRTTYRYCLRANEKYKKGSSSSPGGELTSSPPFFSSVSRSACLLLLLDPLTTIRAHQVVLPSLVSPLSSTVFKIPALCTDLPDLGYLFSFISGESQLHFRIPLFPNTCSLSFGIATCLWPLVLPDLLLNLHRFGPFTLPEVQVKT